MLEHNAIVSEPVEGRGMNVGRAIAPEMVRAHSVNCDENDVGCGLARRRRQAATEQEDHEREELERLFQSKLRLSKKNDHGSRLLLRTRLLRLAHFFLRLGPQPLRGQCLRQSGMIGRIQWS